MTSLATSDEDKSSDAPLASRLRRFGRKVRTKIIPRSRQQKSRPHPGNRPSRVSTFSNVVAHDAISWPPKKETKIEKTPPPTLPTTPPQHEKDDAMSHSADGSLWARAYRKANEDPDFVKLLESYMDFLVERYGLSKQESTSLLESLIEPTSQGQDTPIQKIAKMTLGDLESTRLAFSIGDQKVVVRDQVKKVLNFLTPFKAVIGAAATAEPSASLAWTGVMAVLPFLENIYEQDEKAAEGFERISFVLVRYALLEKDLMQDSIATSVPTSIEHSRVVEGVKDRIVKVYVIVYEYQIRIILQYAHRKPRRVLGDMFLLNDWKQMTKDITDNDHEIDRAVNTVAQSTLRDKLERIDSSINNAMHTVVELQKEISTKLDISILDRIPYVENAVFNSVAVDKQGRCLAGTQRNALNSIQAWAESPDGEPIFWLAGMAGTGKSTIATTVANCLNDRKQFFSRERGLDDRTFLGATFFLSREDPTRNTVKHVFPTIARTMAERIPDIGEHMSKNIFRDSTVGSSRLVEQMESLISEPLAIVSKALLVTVHLVIILDSLDECEKSSEAEQLLRLLPSLGGFHPMDVRVLVISRPEKYISQILDDPDLKVKKFSLEKIPRQIDCPDPDDITKFLRHEITNITQRRGFSQDWIKSDEMNQLVERAGGLFIYAATTCRFLNITDDDEIQGLRLKKLIGGTADHGSPEACLDEIYRTVLTFPTRDMSKDEMDIVFTKYRLILGCVALAFEPPSVVTIEKLIKRRGIRKTLLDFRSILEVSHNDDSAVSFHHLSFRDFLLSKDRSGLEFYIDNTQVHHDLFVSCLAIMSKSLKQDICDLRHPGVLTSDITKSRVYDYIPQHVRYACLYWSGHLNKLDTSKLMPAFLDDGGEVYRFLSTKLLYWLEVLSLLGEYHRSVSIIRHLKSLATPEKSPKLSSFLQDAYRFVLSHNEMISQAPLQTYCSALVFSPRKSIVRANFLSHIPEWITSHTGWRDDWGAELMAIDGRCDEFIISKDGRFLVASTSQNAINVWDITTGSQIATFRYPSEPWKVAISRDSTLVASLLENTISLRSLTGQDETILTTSTRTLESIATSPTEDVLASICGDHMITLWDLKSFKIIEQIAPHGEYNSCGPLVFSPCGQILLAGYRSIPAAGIVAWNFKDQTPKRIQEHDSRVISIAVSPDGENIASSDFSGFLKVRSKATETTEKEIEFDRERKVCSIAWHPKKLWILALGIEPTSIQLCNIATTPPQMIKQIDLPGTLSGPHIGLAFTGDLSILAWADLGGNVRLWDTEVESARRRIIQSFHPLDENGYMFLIVSENSAETLDSRTGLTKPFLSDIRKVVCSPDQNHFAFCLNDDTVQLWDNSFKRQITTFPQFTDIFFPRGGTVMVLMSRNKALILDCPTLNKQFEIELLRDWVPEYGPIFTSQAIGIITRGEKGGPYCYSIWLFQWDTGKLVPGFPQSIVPDTDYEGIGRSVYMSTDGQYVIYETADENKNHSFVAVDVEADYETAILALGGERASTSLAFSPTGKHVIIGTESGTIFVWDLKSMTSVRRLQTGKLPISHVHYCSGEKAMIAIQRDDSIERQCWDIEKETLLQSWTVNESYNPDSLYASTDRQHFDLKEGWFPSQIDNDASSCTILDVRNPGLLDVAGGWLWQGNDRLLRLPMEFNGHYNLDGWQYTSRRKVKWPIKVQGRNIFVIGIRSGDLVRFEFDKSKMSFMK